MSGVPSSLASGRGPRPSVLNVHAICSLLKFVASICSSGEYLLPRKSAVYIGHSPFFVLGIALTCCPDTFWICMVHTSVTNNTAAKAIRIIFPIIVFSPSSYYPVCEAILPLSSNCYSAKRLPSVSRSLEPDLYKGSAAAAVLDRFRRYKGCSLNRGLYCAVNTIRRDSGRPYRSL